ncbi:MAG TPA: phosphoribosyltransferase family protein [Candidatus Saccharimonadales bacterium]|nr:phosphoribosyltransferase family protein [Candidatus Saccharimonadales bacterium]
MAEVASKTQNYKKLLQSKEQVNQRIGEIADEIIKRYEAANPLFVCLLRGGAPFATKLMFAITEKKSDFQPELDYMTVKTYGDERVDKQPELVMDLSPNTDVAGRMVILLDDVLDKGITAEFATNYLMQIHSAEKVDLVVLVQKLRERKTVQNATIFGFELPDVWLTSMGMDDARLSKEANRWRGDIAEANQ